MKKETPELKEEAKSRESPRLLIIYIDFSSNVLFIRVVFQGFVQKNGLLHVRESKTWSTLFYRYLKTSVWDASTSFHFEETLESLFVLIFTK